LGAPRDNALRSNRNLRRGLGVHGNAVSEDKADPAIARGGSIAHKHRQSNPTHPTIEKRPSGDRGKTEGFGVAASNGDGRG